MNYALTIGTLAILGVVAALVIAAVRDCLRDNRLCERCGAVGPLARCPVCGLWICAKCKPHPGICLVCWHTPDGEAADFAEQADQENYTDRYRADVTPVSLVVMPE